MNPTRRSILKWSGLALVTSPLVGLLTLSISGPSLLEKQREAARREGIPLTPEDLRPSPPIPDSQNAGPLLKELTERYNAISETEQKAWDNLYDAFSKSPDDPAVRETFRASLSRYSDLMQLAERAAKRPHCDMGYDYSLGPNLLLPELAILRRFARLLSARAFLASDADSAWQDIARAAKLGNLIYETPCLIAALVGVAIHGIADRAYIATLKRFGPSPLAHETLTAFGPPPAPEHYFGGEVVMGTMTMKLLREGKLRRSDQELEEYDGCGEGNMWNGLSAYAPLVAPFWEKQILIFWRRAFPQIREVERTEDYGKLNHWLEAEADHLSQDKLNAPQNMMMAVLFPAFSQAINKTHVYTLAQRRLRESALILSEVKAKTGSFPDAPKLPADPFSPDKQPLRYRKEGNGCVLYSVGQDHTDDGGREKREKNSEKLDLVVRL